MILCARRDEGRVRRGEGVCYVSMYDVPVDGRASGESIAAMSFGKRRSGAAWMPNQAAVLYVYAVIASIVVRRLDVCDIDIQCERRNGRQERNYVSIPSRQGGAPVSKDMLLALYVSNLRCALRST